MKSLYKIIIIGLLCLFTKSLMAQDRIIGQGAEPIEIIGDDDGETPLGLPPLSCYCFYSSSYLAFQNELNAQSGEQIWLMRQEAAMKVELEKRFNKSFTTFRDAQKELFSKMSENIKAPQYYNQVSDYINQNFTYSGNNIANAEASYKTITGWYNEYNRIRNGLPRTHQFGDLKYNNTKIENITHTTSLATAVSVERNKYNQELNKKVNTLNWRNKLVKARETKAFQNWIAERYLDYYYSLGYKDAIKAMSIYMVSDWAGSTAGPVLPPSSFFPTQVYWSSDHDYYNQMINVTNSQSITPTVATGANLSTDEAILRYAINSMGTQNSRFLYRSEHKNVRTTAENYLKGNTFNSASLNNIENAVDGYVNNKPKNNFIPNHFFSSTSNNLPQNFGVDLAYKFTYNTSGEANGLRGLSNFYHDLYNLDENHYRLEGHRIRLALIYSNSNIDLHGISDEELGQFFNFSAMYPFGNFNYNFFLEYSLDMHNFLNENNLSLQSLVNNRPLFSLIGAISEAYQTGVINSSELSNLFNYMNNEGLSTETILFIENALDVLAQGGEVNFEDQILSLLTGKEKCVNDLLTNTNSSFLRTLLSHFEPQNSEFSVFIRSVDKITNPHTLEEMEGSLGLTYKLNNSPIIQIQINKTGLASRSMLYTAKTILHEYVHAEIRRRIHTTDLTGENLEFGIAWIEYIRQNLDGDHEAMVEFYLEAMASTLESFHKTALEKDFDIMTQNLSEDYPNGLTRDFYRRLSWEGLHETEAFVRLRQENPVEFQAIDRALLLEETRGGSVDDQISCPN